MLFAEEEPNELGQAGVGTNETANVQLTLELLYSFLLEAILFVLFTEEVDLASKALPERRFGMFSLLGLRNQALDITSFKPVL